METFTLEEARRWIGRRVIAKTTFNAGRALIAAEQQGTVIGVQGEHSLHGEPVLCLAVQFWPEQTGEVPNVIFVTQQVLGFPQFWSKKQRSVVTICHYMD
jgi:hypothetical protein